MPRRGITFHITEVEDGVDLEYIESGHADVHRLEVRRIGQVEWGTLEYIDDPTGPRFPAKAYTFVDVNDVDQYARAWAEQLVGRPVTEIISKVNTLARVRKE